ncbi:MAG: sigma-54 factor interaction domain-containing protein, partial [Proteobacteria bacterium]|nr:sigma-54 factor interaction domain-containing protein [Pseudomonadota bacterium]
MFNFGNSDAFTSIVGHSPALESVIRTAQIAAAADVHILIEGDTGTGKELMAQALQQSSKRADKPFVIINCAALPAELVESLLFGHEQGAFTGAHEKKDGYVQKAQGGTIFLDEIGELPLSLQAKLLRFVESGECQRIGSHETEIIDARIIAATHRNLLKLIDEGLFRQDLFYRLSVVTLRLPSLK